LPCFALISPSACSLSKSREPHARRRCRWPSPLGTPAKIRRFFCCFRARLPSFSLFDFPLFPRLSTLWSHMDFQVFLRPHCPGCLPPSLGNPQHPPSLCGPPAFHSRADDNIFSLGSPCFPLVLLDRCVCCGLMVIPAGFVHPGVALRLPVGEPNRLLRLACMRHMCPAPLYL